ncbi:MAG: DUF1919 domain-containing protein [Mediterraneibacter sp.]
MIKLCEASQCTGCEACRNICPIHCIDMVTDSRGFLIPQIQQEQCISCGRCQKVCPALNPMKLNRPIQVIAACEKDEKERNKAASGGLAGVFYKEMIRMGGTAYGVILNKEKLAVYTRSESEEEVEQYRGSKYVGSRMDDIYLKVQKDLKEGRKVLFIGMGCQTAGLLNFLGNGHRNLLTVDILCHGMPSHLYFKEYMEKIETEKGGYVSKVSFRENNLFRLKYQCGAHVYEQKAKYNKYYAGYTSMLFYRDSCYTCPYARVERNSDITLGDFWGYGADKRMGPPGAGVSMVLLNTEKGRLFFESVKNEVCAVGSTIERAMQINSQLNGPSPAHELRDEFMRIYSEFGFTEASDKVIGKIIHRNMIKTVKQEIKRNLLLPVRGARKIKKTIVKLTGRKNIGKWMRKLWRSRFERKKLINTDFTILSNTCIGGIISHDMGLKFLSPTVNIYIRPEEFVKFVKDLDYYLSLELTEIYHPAPYPVAKLGELTLYLKHFNTFEEAKEKWEERKKRINFQKIYVIMTDRDFTPPDKARNACPKKVLEEFNKLPYKKICFTAEEYTDLECCKRVSKNKDGNCVNIITDIVSYSGKRLYQFAEQFDYIKWLNEQE